LATGPMTSARAGDARGPLPMKFGERRPGQGLLSASRLGIPPADGTDNLRSQSLPPAGRPRARAECWISTGAAARREPIMGWPAPAIRPEQVSTACGRRRSRASRRRKSGPVSRPPGPARLRSCIPNWGASSDQQRRAPRSAPAPLFWTRRSACRARGRSPEPAIGAFPPALGLAG
jgi:hypothetical protein